MRKRIAIFFTLVVSLLLLNFNGQAFTATNPLVNVKNLAPGNKDYLRASVFVKLSSEEFAAITGKKLSFPQRIYFKLIQRRLKHQLKKNPDLLITSYYDPTKAKFKFDALWFVVGAFIGPLGVLVAYTSKPRKGGPARKDKITSAWLGFGLFILWFGYLFLF